MSRRHALLLGSLLAALSLGARLAHADGATATVTGEVLVILGKTEGQGIDPQLASLEALTKAPFDSFPQKKLLSRSALSLTVGQRAEVALPNGRKLQLSLLGRTTEGRFRVSVSINRPGKQDYLPLMTVAATPGDPFFVAGQKHEGGTLIIGVRVGSPD